VKVIDMNTVLGEYQIRCFQHLGMMENSHIEKKNTLRI